MTSALPVPAPLARPAFRCAAFEVAAPASGSSTKPCACPRAQMTLFPYVLYFLAGTAVQAAAVGEPAHLACTAHDECTSAHLLKHTMGDSEVATEGRCIQGHCRRALKSAAHKSSATNTRSLEASDEKSVTYKAMVVQAANSYEINDWMENSFCLEEWQCPDLEMKWSDEQFGACNPQTLPCYAQLPLMQKGIFSWAKYAACIQMHLFTYARPHPIPTLPLHLSLTQSPSGNRDAHKQGAEIVVFPENGALPDSACSAPNNAGHYNNAQCWTWPGVTEEEEPMICGDTSLPEDMMMLGCIAKATGVSCLVDCTSTPAPLLLPAHVSLSPPPSLVAGLPGRQHGRHAAVPR